MGKYRDALEKIKRNITEALTLLVYGEATKALFVELETNTYDYVNTLRELVDRAKQVKLYVVIRELSDEYSTSKSMVIAFYDKEKAYQTCADYTAAQQKIKKYDTYTSFHVEEVKLDSEDVE